MNNIAEFTPKQVNDRITQILDETKAAACAAGLMMDMPLGPMSAATVMAALVKAYMAGRNDRVIG